VQLDIDSDGWPAPETASGWDALAERCAEAAADCAPELANARLEASLLFTSDDEVHQLNKEWRERDKPTNVLSFPMLTRAELLDLDAAKAETGPPIMLGDLALAHETCVREAAEKGISTEHHTAHLIIHGLLHLAGYDHETSDEDAEKMEALEVQILAKLGIPDPYSVD